MIQIRRGMALSMGLAGALLLFGDATAQTSGTAPVADLQLAQELYQYGQRTQGALAVIVAARIVANTPTQDTQRAKTEKKAEAGNLPPIGRSIETARAKTARARRAPQSSHRAGGQAWPGRDFRDKRRSWTARSGEHDPDCASAGGRSEPDLSI